VFLPKRGCLNTKKTPSTTIKDGVFSPIRRPKKTKNTASISKNKRFPQKAYIIQDKIFIFGA
jgi:hypothetical protein